MKILSCILAAVVIAINMYFVGHYATETFTPVWYVILALVVFGILYLAFCAYLVLHVIASMGFSWFEGSNVSWSINLETFRGLITIFDFYYFLKLIFRLFEK